jgi:ATP-dependent Clp protease ATP-binding subunit ClpA
MGARPMARLIQDTIRKALADELLFGRLANGGRVTVDIDENEVVRLVFAEEAVALLPPPALPAPTS